MDTEVFDRLTRLVGSATTRRTALGALTALGSVLGPSTAAARRRKNRRSGGSRSRAGQPRGNGGSGSASSGACARPRRGATLAGCDFSGQSFVGVDLHGITARGADFSRANLCGADLHGATLAQADFSQSVLVRANLRGATTGRAGFGDAVFCQTIMPDGSLNNDGCSGLDSGFACCLNAECSEGQFCNTGFCQDVGDVSFGCRPQDDSCSQGGTECPLNDEGFCVSGRDDGGVGPVLDVCAFQASGLICLDADQDCSHCAEIMPTAHFCLRLIDPEGCGCDSGLACVLPAPAPLPGGGSGSPDDYCFSDVDCQQGEKCNRGICGGPCASDADCHSNHPTCCEGRCVDLSDNPFFCGSCDGECYPPPQSCRNGECIPR